MHVLKRTYKQTWVLSLACLHLDWTWELQRSVWVSACLLRHTHTQTQTHFQWPLHANLSSE